MTNSTGSVHFKPKFMVDAQASSRAAVQAAQAIVRQNAIKRVAEAKKTAVARVEYHQKFGNWPKTTTLDKKARANPMYQDGQWLGQPYHEVEELTGRVPKYLTDKRSRYHVSYNPKLLAECFEWRKLPELQSNRTFVDYFRLHPETMAGTRSDFDIFMSAVMSLKDDVSEVRCSILFHATSMDAVDKILPTGFQNFGAPSGAMCGHGAYNAIYPYVDYTMGNARFRNSEYIEWNKGFGAIIVSVGVVVPSEYTYNQVRSAQKAGTHGARGTRNAKAVCGGSFLSTEVDADGKMDMNHREIVYWFDKTKYICPLGIAIFKK